jgi:hypothetical protein
MGFKPVTVVAVVVEVPEDQETPVQSRQAVLVDQVAPRKSPGERCSSPEAVAELEIFKLMCRAVVAKVGVEPPEIRGSQEHPTQAAVAAADPGMG